MPRTFRPERFRLDPRHPLSDGLTFAWLGGNGGFMSGQLVDSSVYERHAALGGYSGSGDSLQEVWSADPRLGRDVLRFDGTNDYASIQTGTVPATQGPIGIAFWVYPLAFGNRGVYGQFAANGTDGTLITLGYGAGDKVELWHNGAGPAVTGTSDIPASAWTHVAINRYGSSSAWTVDIYLNGELDKHGTTTANHYSGTSYPIAIGRPGGYAGFYFSGSLADFVIRPYSVFTQHEIRILADRSDPSLGGWLIPTSRSRRRCKQTQAFMPHWSTSCNTLLGV